MSEPIPLRFLDVTVPGEATVQLTLYPADTVETKAGPSRLVVQFKERSDETFTLYLGPGVMVRESSGFQHPIPLDERGQPRRFDTFEEYQMYLAARE
jgi:hypothetical protein